jgi:metal-responsive CopG/Arc/MetJ family transcriptional regulator
MKTKKNPGIDVQNPRSTNRAKRSPKLGSIRAGRQRILIEFPSSLLERADEAAAQLEKNRSELIRTAVEKLLDGIEREKFEAELAAAYVANSARNLDLLEEFAHVDREGF